jgi:hypothetical protein
MSDVPGARTDIEGPTVYHGTMQHNAEGTGGTMKLLPVPGGNDEERSNARKKRIEVAADALAFELNEALKEKFHVQWGIGQNGFGQIARIGAVQMLKIMP